MSTDKADIILQQLKEYRVETREFLEKLDRRMDMMEKRQTKTEVQLYLYRSLINFCKAIGVAVIFIITFRFGDILKLWGKG